jgi:hypothetical protein
MMRRLNEAFRSLELSQHHRALKQVRAKCLRTVIVGSNITFLLSMCSCGQDGLDCNSAEVRDSVLRFVSGDTNNALVAYAVRTSPAVQSKVDESPGNVDQIKASERKSAVYRLSTNNVTTSQSRDKSTFTCSGTVFTTVTGETAQKTVDYRIQKVPNQPISVSVTAFSFDPSRD